MRLSVSFKVMFRGEHSIADLAIDWVEAAMHGVVQLARLVSLLVVLAEFGISEALVTKSARNVG